jgi:hypothetical protein
MQVMVRVRNRRTKAQTLEPIDEYDSHLHLYQSHSMQETQPSTSVPSSAICRSRM